MRQLLAKSSTGNKRSGTFRTGGRNKDMLDKYVDASVVVITHNCTSEVMICLEHLASQTFSGTWELILSDHGSDEDIYALARDILKGSHFRFTYVKTPWSQECRAYARNTGLRLARGKIAIFLDGDMAVPKDFVAAHVTAHSESQNNKSLIYGSRLWVFDSDVPRTVSRTDFVSGLTGDLGIKGDLYSEMPFQEKYARSDYAWLGCLGCNLSVSRLGQDNYFDEAFQGWGSEDQEFACRLARRHGFRLVFAPDICGVHLQNGTRTSFRPVKAEDHSSILKYLRNVLYFCDLYPEIDMTPACRGLGFFDFDEGTGTWGVATSPRFDDAYIREVVHIARRDYRN